VQSPAEELHEVLPMAIDRLSQLDCIIIEGNSAIEFLKPDVVVFISDASKENIKPSAQIILKQSDIVIEKGASHYSSKNIHELINRIEMTAKKKETENILKTRSTEGSISCNDARKIAEELGVSYKEVGKAANELKIKIKDCELGCF
jgi:LAO/AO transport system kinase